ncbi:SDR family oxidoreductase [Vineibacter terrae]|uniref:SDR family NAD(P)-dependent oxidoreductase n=1 Tax=Vineibacter terrae TaxID=2586908 RepID=UPI002E350DF0|nr:SDR family oxidoreductase [Vineibacter terrae]HEX2890294.1 SDR family oxidoreductase [Vineibacter terrae]
MDLGLSGKSVIVTGGGSNIGRAVALGFAREGADITIGELDAGQGEAVAQEARRLGAAGAQAVATDVTDMAQVQRLVDAALQRCGKLDVLVNCVGWDQLMFFTQTTPDFWEKIVRINYFSVLNCTRAVLEPMIKAGSGAIVSLSSDASRQGEPREAVYGGIKAGINAFMKTIARENGRYGIRCNVVCPGVTIPETDGEVSQHSMWARKGAMFTDEQLEKVAKALPLRRIGRPNDVANAVLFLASDAASYVTGQVLSVSGGYSMVG